MRHKDESEMVVSEALKHVRMLIRAKHSRAADREINDTLPRIEAEILKRLNAGKPFRLDAKTLDL